MRTIQKSHSGMLLTESMLLQFPVTSMVEQEGAEGLGMFIATCQYLKKCYHSIGSFSDIPAIARSIRKTAQKFKEWLLKYRIFDVDSESGLFVYGTYRRLFKLESEVTERESEVVHIYGNKIKKEPGEYTEQHPEKCAVTEHESEPECAGECTDDERRNDDDSTAVERADSQHSDNKADTDLLYIHKSKSMGKCIIRKGNNNNNTNPSSIDSGGGGESSFKFFEEKILDSTAWRKSTSQSLCINLEDDSVARFFARWMYDYCVSKGKMCEIRGDNGVLVYAANLLVRGMRTRMCFDEALRKSHVRDTSPQDAPQCAVREQHRARGTFERISNGVRYGLGNQPLPNDAPYQTDPNTRWSYIEHRWVARDKWNGKREMAVAVGGCC